MATSSKLWRVRNPRTLPPLVLSTEQIDQFIRIANADPSLHITRDVVLVLSETGIRAGELCELRVSDVDVANNRLFIPGTRSEGRCVPLSPRALSALQSLLARHPRSAFVLGEEPSRLLRRVSLSFRKISGQIGATGQSLHCLRRFFAKRLASGGISPVTLARLMGHSSSRLTERYYCKSARS